MDGLTYMMIWHLALQIHPYEWLKENCTHLGCKNYVTTRAQQFLIYTRTMEKRQSKPFVAVHVGAGYHSVLKETLFKAVCSNACDSAMKILKDGGDAVQACVEAVKVLEDDPVTNAGTGSSLNRDGYVECDAALMDGRSMIFGAVGALPCTFSAVIRVQSIYL